MNELEAILLKRVQELRFVIQHAMEEFNDRYDGAEDAHMQWMGHLMYEMTEVLHKTKQFESGQAHEKQ